MVEFCSGRILIRSTQTIKKHSLSTKIFSRQNIWRQLDVKCSCNQLPNEQWKTSLTRAIIQSRSISNAIVHTHTHRQGLRRQSRQPADCMRTCRRRQALHNGVLACQWPARAVMICGQVCGTVSDSGGTRSTFHFTAFVSWISFYIYDKSIS